MLLNYPGLSESELGIEETDCLKNEKAGSCAGCRKILKPPSLRLATREGPQRGDSPVSTFAGRMEQSCVVELGSMVLDP